MLGVIGSQLRALCAVTAQVGPVYKGSLNRGFSGTPTRTGAGAYTLTTDSQTNMTLLPNAAAEVVPFLSLLTNVANTNGGATIATANTITVTTWAAAVATDVDFALLLLAIN